MRARTLLSVLLVAAAVAGCGREGVTGPDASGAGRRSTESPGGGTGGTVQGGYLGSGNRTDSTSTEPVTPSTTVP